MEQLVDFGNAMVALKEGKVAARKGWNGNGLFVFKQVHADIDAHIVPGMQSLPDAVKQIFMNRFNNAEELHKDKADKVDPHEMNQIHYRNQFCLVDQRNNIYGWAPSASDAAAEDWIVL